MLASLIWLCIHVHLHVCLVFLIKLTNHHIFVLPWEYCSILRMTLVNTMAHEYVNHLHLCFWQMLLSKMTYMAFRVYIWLFHAFIGNQTHGFGVASALLFCLCYRSVCVPASEFRNAFCILQSESFAISFHIVSCLIIPSIKWQNGKYKKQLPLFSSGDLRSDLYHTNKTDPLEYGLLSSVCPIWQPHSKINQFKCLLCCIDYRWQEFF